MRIFTEGKMYFAVSYRKDEIECLRQAQPANILTSFAMWRTKSEDKDLTAHLYDKIGYKPESVIVDCGSFTFRTEDYGITSLIENYAEMLEEDGIDFDINNDFDLMKFSHHWLGEFEEDAYLDDKNGFNLFQQYLNFLWSNKGSYDYCFAFDRIGDNNESLLSYRIMKALGLPVIPVYQATIIGSGDRKNNHEHHILDYYAKHSDYIGIGGTAISKVKGYSKAQRIAIVQEILEKYPKKKFHLLGTLDVEIVEACHDLYSFDGQCWLQKVEKPYKVNESVNYLKNKTLWFMNKKRSLEQLKLMRRE